MRVPAGGEATVDQDPALLRWQKDVKTSRAIRVRARFRAALCVLMAAVLSSAVDAARCSDEQRANHVQILAPQGPSTTIQANWGGHQRAERRAQRTDAGSVFVLVSADRPGSDRGTLCAGVEASRPRLLCALHKKTGRSPPLAIS